MLRLSFLAAVSLLLALSSTAQVTSISVRWMERGPEDPDAEISRIVGSSIRENLQLRGLDLKGRELRLMVRAHSHFSSEGELVAISIVEGGGMTEARVDAGAKAQIFYAGQAEPENPDEARFVREVVTKDWMKQFVIIYEMVQIVTPRESIQREMSSYVDQLLHRMTCMADDSCQ